MPQTEREVFRGKAKIRSTAATDSLEGSLLQDRVCVCWRTNGSEAVLLHKRPALRGKRPSEYWLGRAARAGNRERVHERRDNAPARPLCGLAPR